MILAVNALCMPELNSAAGGFLVLALAVSGANVGAITRVIQLGSLTHWHCWHYPWILARYGASKGIA